MKHVFNLEMCWTWTDLCKVQSRLCSDTSSCCCTIQTWVLEICPVGPQSPLMQTAPDELSIFSFCFSWRPRWPESRVINHQEANQNRQIGNTEVFSDRSCWRENDYWFNFLLFFWIRLGLITAGSSSDVGKLQHRPWEVTALPGEVIHLPRLPLCRKLI